VRALQGLWVLKVQPALLVLKAILASRDLKVSRVQRVLKVLKVSLD
jgi:hypothetical protein